MKLKQCFHLMMDVKRDKTEQQVATCMTLQLRFMELPERTL
jgi:hypothetical protein